MIFKIDRASNNNYLKPIKPTDNAVKFIIDNEKHEWHIKINEIDELMAIVEKEGDIIIGRIDVADSLPYITIYDDYVE